MQGTLAALAVVYAVSSGAPLGVGERLRPGSALDRSVRGVLLPEHGVVQLPEGAQARLAAEPGRIELERGEARLVAERTLSVRAGSWVIVVDRGDALVRIERGEVTACATRASVRIEGVTGRAAPIPPGTCMAAAEGGARGAGALDPARVEAAALAVQSAPASTIEGIDIVGDPSEQVSEVETELADALERGPRREAASCGCAEGGGASGVIDTGGPSTPPPDPEQPDPGRIRIRIVVPSHD